MKQLFAKGLIALLIAILAITAVVPQAAQAQGTLPPSGICVREGEVQLDTNWIAICANGVWGVGTADPTRTTFALATPAAIANPTPAYPLPMGAPTSLNGLLLPTTATSTAGDLVTWGAYMFGTYTFAQMTATDVIYVAATEAGAKFLAGRAVMASGLSAGTPVIVLGAIFFATKTGVEWFTPVKQATITYPTAIAAPEAPTIFYYKDIEGSRGNYRFFEGGGGNCRVEKFVSWYENGQLQSKLFTFEKPCMKDPNMNKASLLSGLHSKISEWIKSGLIAAEVIKQVSPYLDDIMGLIIKAWKSGL